MIGVTLTRETAVAVAWTVAMTSTVIDNIVVVKATMGTYFEIMVL